MKEVSLFILGVVDHPHTWDNSVSCRGEWYCGLGVGIRCSGYLTPSFLQIFVRAPLH